MDISKRPIKTAYASVNHQRLMLQLFDSRLQSSSLSSGLLGGITFLANHLELDLPEL